MSGLLEAILRRFEDRPSQLRVVRKMLSYGISVRNGSLYCNDVEITYAALARACDADQRVVMEVVRTISSDRYLRSVFEKIRAVPNLAFLARELGYGALEIAANDPTQKGIVAEVTSVIASEGLSIKQVIAEDPGLFEDPRLYVITDRPVPESAINRLRKIKEIRSITIYS
ncbi:MAG: hypothetical protein ACP5LW_06470 [Nitrososphaeria archaeon]